MSTNNIFAEERKDRIVEYINNKTKATVLELCDYFDMSQATIRNDLKELANAGRISRVHGGAIANKSVNYEQNQAEAQTVQTREKKAITDAALKYIHEGDCIALDAGSTCHELARKLGQFQDLTIVTYDLKTAAWLDENTNLTVIIAGGIVRKGFHYVTGDSAIRTISNLHVDTAFMSANGVDVVNGLTTPKIDTAEIKKVLLKNARKVVLLADSDKMGNISFAQFGTIRDVDYFITDFGARQEDLIEMEANDVKVQLVSTESE